jgi:hypothetical protein
MRFEYAVVICIIVVITLGFALKSALAYWASLGISGASAFARGCRDGSKYAKT